MKISRLPFFLFLVLTASTISAQPFFQWHDAIQVKLGSSYIKNPWAGGLNHIQASEIDMNMDGKKDLFIFDRTGDMVRTYINNGSAGTVNYTYDPSYESKFPRMHGWALLADYNCDGKQDIYCYSSIGGGLDIYKNTSTATNLQFTKMATQQKSIYWPPSVGPSSLINLYVSIVDIPAISDIDNDGDLDIVTFTIGGTRMEYHKNMSKELYGSCDSLRFQMGNHCWGYAAENALSNDYTLFDTCGSNVPSPELPVYEGELRETDRHAGSCQLCIDLNADGDKEFIVGDVSFDNLTMLTNGGNPTDASFVAIDTAFPANNSSTVSVDLTIFPCAFYLDVNFDGVKDLIVSPSAPNVSENFNSVVYYSNVGTDAFPVFQFQQSNMLQDNMIEVGEGAYPVFFDYDSDGLKDLFIGNYGYYNAAGYQHQIAQFRNVGTSTAPEFQLITRDYDGFNGTGTPLSSLNIVNMVPAFGDMDADGDADMFIGGYDGKIHYFKNIASAGTTAHFVLTTPNYKNSAGRVIDVGDFATPQIADVDSDGKNDLVIGARNGKLAYYHHTGTAALPALDSMTHFFGNVKVNDPFMFTGYSHPYIFKQGSTTKLLVGAESGYLRLYDNIDGNLTGAFNLVDSTYLDIWEGTRSAPSGTDLDNDGLMDLVVGNYQGGVSYFKGVSSIITVNDMNEPDAWDLQLFPNPADESITLQINNAQHAVYSVELYNLMGQLLRTEQLSGTSIRLMTGELPQGMYFCKVSILGADHLKAASLTKRIVIRH